MLDRNVQDCPEREALVAVSCESGSWLRHTWRELDNIVSRVALGLLEKGVHKGSRVAFMQTNCAECFYTYLAVHKIGANFVPINIMLVAREVEYVLRNSDAKFVVAGADFSQVIEKAGSEIQDLTVFCIHKEGAPVAPETALSFSILLNSTGKLPDTVVSEGDVADVLYTSGTTGQPKGVILTHGNKVANGRMAGAALDIVRSHYGCERSQASFPFFTSASVSTAAMSWLYYGYTFIQDPRFDVEDILRTIQREKTTRYVGSPSMIKFMLSHSKIDEYDTSSLRSLSYGGSAMPEDLLSRIFDRWPRVTTYDLYGLTEAGPGGTRLRMMASDRSKLGSIGTPWPPDQEVRVVDLEGREVGVGEVGEIIIKGPNVMKEYLANESATAQALKNGWLHSGDLGYFDEDGYFYYADRIKDMIVRGGHNVYPVEVENVLYEHPGVRQCAVVGKPHPMLGEDVLALVVLQEGFEVAAEELIAFCEDKLAVYKRPRDLRIVDQLPLTSMGKMDKKKLRSHYC